VSEGARFLLGKFTFLLFYLQTPAFRSGAKGIRTPNLRRAKPARCFAGECCSLQNTCKSDGLCARALPELSDDSRRLLHIECSRSRDFEQLFRFLMAMAAVGKSRYRGWHRRWRGLNNVVRLVVPSRVQQYPEGSTILQLRGLCSRPKAYNVPGERGSTVRRRPSGTSDPDLHRGRTRLVIRGAVGSLGLQHRWYGQRYPEGRRQGHRAGEQPSGHFLPVLEAPGGAERQEEPSSCGETKPQEPLARDLHTIPKPRRCALAAADRIPLLGGRGTRPRSCWSRGCSPRTSPPWAPRKGRPPGHSRGRGSR
jgi:hypothetical protein